MASCCAAAMAGKGAAAICANAGLVVNNGGLPFLLSIITGVTLACVGDVVDSFSRSAWCLKAWNRPHADEVRHGIVEYCFSGMYGELAPVRNRPFPLLEPWRRSYHGSARSLGARPPAHLHLLHFVPHGHQAASVQSSADLDHHWCNAGA